MGWPAASAAGRLASSISVTTSSPHLPSPFPATFDSKKWMLRLLSLWHHTRAHASAPSFFSTQPLRAKALDSAEHSLERPSPKA